MNTLAIIIPWFKKLPLFKVAVRQNRLFLDRRVQVVIVMDEPSEEKEAVDFIASIPHVNWKVIVNDKPHGWRPPCKAINVGIRNSTSTHIAVMSPETMLNLPTNEYLFRVITKLKTRRYYLTGQIYNIQFNDEEMSSPCFADNLEYRRTVLKERPKDGFGFILTPRETIEAINCYDESRKKWGGDDDDIRLRLRRAKCKYICDPQIRLVHMWHTDTDRKGSHERFGRVVKLMNQADWGMEFNRIAYETRNESQPNSSEAPSVQTNVGESAIPEMPTVQDEAQTNQVNRDTPAGEITHETTNSNPQVPAQGEEVSGNGNNPDENAHKADQGSDEGHSSMVPANPDSQPQAEGNNPETVVPDAGQGLETAQLSPEQIEIIKESWNMKTT